MTTFTNYFQKKNYGRILSLGMALTLAVTPAIPSSAKTTEKNSFDQQVLTRVDSVSDSGYIRSHLEDAQGRRYTNPQTNSADNGSSTFSDLDSGNKKSTNLPSSYDSRDYGYATSIKDQGKSGCCWAFSAIKVLEANGIRSGLFPKEAADFSESHLAWFSYSLPTDFNDPLYGDGMTAVSTTATDMLSSLSPNGSANTYAYDHGGSATLATFTLARGSGPVAEAVAPFDAASKSAIQAMANSMAKQSSLRYNASYRLQNSISFDEYTVSENYYYKDTSMIADMKQAVLDYGAVSIGIYYDKTRIKASKAGTSYYQRVYTDSSAVKAANHCVTIVGWDDTYSRSNFSSQPSGDGAWLIANSYGTEFGDNGYFWLSYYEPSICDCFSFNIGSAEQYKNIYQYDGFGWSNANYSNSKDIKAANIFTANTNSPQALQAVSFYTLTDDQKYTIQIYRGVSSKPTDGVLIDEATTSGTIEHNGYYTIPLTTPVNIAAGEKFSVVVTYHQSGSKTVYIPFEGKDKTTSNYSLQYSSKLGQSFLYTGLSKTSKSSWYDTSSLGYNNVCIKVFANDTAAADAMPVKAGKVTLGKGETYQLTQDGNSFTSGNPSIATVSASGKIKARKVGTTTITISTDSNTKVFTVIVKKAPSRIRIKPSGKKKIKKGKKFKIKVKLPSGSASHKIRFRSSRNKVVSVDSKGKVTAKRKGKAVIKVKTFNGKTARLKVIVK